MIATSLWELQRHLEALERYAAAKGLQVNTNKSHVVVFNSRGESAGRWRPTYQGEPLALKPEFKYLGITLDRNCSMLIASQRWAGALSAATQDLYKRAKELGVQRKVLAMLVLHQAYATPSAMYGCQVWGSRFLDWGRPFESPVERRRMAFLRRQLGLRPGVERHVLLREAGAKPLLFYWARSIFRLYSKLRDESRVGASPLMAAVLGSDLVLAGWGAQGAGSWAAEVASALRALEPSWADTFLAGEPIDVPQVVRAVSRKLFEVPWCPPDVSSKRARYLQVCGEAKPGEAVRQPKYVWMEGISRHEVRQLARLRTSCHNLALERGAWRRARGDQEVDELPRSHRVCTRCSSQWCDWRDAMGPRGWRGELGAGGRPIDDEFHLLFECEATSALRLGTQRLWEGNWSAADAVKRVMGEMGSRLELARFAAACMDVADAAAGDN